MSLVILNRASYGVCFSELNLFAEQNSGALKQMCLQLANKGNIKIGNFNMDKLRIFWHNTRILNARQF